MKRGSLVVVRGPGGPAANARPCLLIQRSSTLAAAPKVTVCPLTSVVSVGSAVRPLVQPSPENGLRRVSQIETDWIFTYPVSRLGATIGQVDDATMRQVDLAIRRWLDL